MLNPKEIKKSCINCWESIFSCDCIPLTPNIECEWFQACPHDENYTLNDGTKVYDKCNEVLDIK